MPAYRMLIEPWGLPNHRAMGARLLSYPLIEYYDRHAQSDVGSPAGQWIGPGYPGMAGARVR